MKNLNYALLMICISIFMVSCNRSTPTVEAGASNAVLTGNYNPTGILNWTGKGVGHSHNGTVGISKASVSFKEGILSAAEFEVDMNTITAESLESDTAKHAKLISHLKSSDFFTVDSFPTAKFVMTSYANNTINGDMTLKGITKPIQFPLTIAEDSIGFTINGNIDLDRTLFNVQAGSAKFFDIKKLGDHLIEDIIKISFELKGTK